MGSVRGVSLLRNFYPRSPCGERPYIIGYSVNFHAISIHALLAESDHSRGLNKAETIKFLSTLSLRRATVVSAELRVFQVDISIHALLAESDSG